MRLNAGMETPSDGVQPGEAPADDVRGRRTPDLGSV